MLEARREEVGKDIDVFDLICYIAFDQPALTRLERAKNVRKRNYFGKYNEVAREVLDKLLEKYEKEGIVSIEDAAVLKLQLFNEIGTPVKLVRAFGKKPNFEKAVKELENEIYSIA